MASKTLSCRLHGGTFTIEAKRGRPPTKCGGEYPTCSEFEGTEGVSRDTAKRRTRVVTKENTPTAAQKGRPAPRPGSEAAKRAPKPAPQKSRKARVEVLTAEEVREVLNEVQTPAESPKAYPCQPALGAKARLEAHGWSVKGRAWVEPVNITPDQTLGGVHFTSIDASRDEERISMTWANDTLKDQQYHLWDMEQPHKNEMPEKGISSEFDEFTDKELVAHMAGKKVTWWNKLGKNKETAECPESVKIVHNYNGVGDETPADRIVTICDHGGTGFRSFRVGQILKIG